MSNEFSWDEVLNIWFQRLLECGIGDIKFKQFTLPIEELVPLEYKLEWRYKNDLKAQVEAMHNLWSRNPSVAWSHNTLMMNSGQERTLEMLWHHNDSLKRKAAIMISGYLYPIVACSRPTGRDIEFCLGLDTPELGRLYRIAASQVFGKDKMASWPYTCTRVLPNSPEFGFIKLKDLKQIIEYIAERNALMLHKYQPIKLNFVSPNN